MSADFDLRRRRRGTLHVLYSLRAEGCPRLAQALLEEEQQTRGSVGAVAVATTADQELAPEFAALGVPIFALDWQRGKYLGVASRLRRLLPHLRPDGIVCYTIGIHVAVAAAARLAGIPTVVHVGNSPPWPDRRALAKIRLQMLAARPFVSRYAACSEYVRRQTLRAYHLSPRSVVTIPNGIRLERFARVRAVRAQRAPAGRPLMIGMVGSLEIHKDQDVLLQAAARLRRAGTNLRLRLVGSGSREAELRARARELSIEDSVEFCGSVRDVPSALAELDIFAYAVRDEEGLGIALVEALAAGLPVVASDVGACREVLQDGQLGTLIGGRDPSAWAEALVREVARPPAPIAALARYDVRCTAAAYDGLLVGTGGTN